MIDSALLAVSFLCLVGQACTYPAQPIQQVARKSQRQPDSSLLGALCAGSKQNIAHDDHWITAGSLHHFFIALLLYIQIRAQQEEVYT